MSSAVAIHRGLTKRYPQAVCPLHYQTPWQLVVAVQLSAQCTDERVNLVTPALFKALPTVQRFAKAEQETVEQLIYSTGFYRNKSKNLIGAAKLIVAEHKGKIPKSMPELLALPGIARKTANVILSELFQQNDGVVVDTHVGRLARRMGLTKHKDPVKVEQDLMKLLPQKDWRAFSLRLVFFGREICDARKPRCVDCPLVKSCPRVGLSPLK